MNADDDRALAAAERAAIAEEVASLVRHDLRNRLAAIRNATAYLGTKVQKTELWQQDPRVSRFFALIGEEADAADGGVIEKLSIRRGTIAVREPVELAACVVRALGRAADGRVVRELASNRRVHADALEVVLLIRALVDNAVESGAATVTAAVGDDGDTVVLRVTDDGPGFDPEATQAFVSSRAGHAGIGLSMVHRIARRDGAKVAVVSSGAGTTVTVAWPAIP
jgi:signal transduction histidine kinase